MELLDRVRRTIRDHHLAGHDTRVIVALSGGSDSVALAHLMRELDVSGELRLSGFAHFNHQLRPSADGDERFCLEAAGALGLPLLVGREDVRTRARKERRSIEDAARTARHTFLEQAREQLDADVVATGHTRDDQAETLLLRLLRGAGARGLAGMHPRRGAIVRPLLECRRAELRAHLEVRSIEYVHDESNADVGIPRNRVRVELLPLLEARFNPSVVNVLADESEIAREEWRWMESMADDVGPLVCQREANEWRFDVARLNETPVALGRVIVRRAMVEASGGRPVTFTHVEDGLRLARLGGSPYDGPGFRARRFAETLVLTRRTAKVQSSRFRYPLPVPGEVRSVEGNWIVSAEVGAAQATPLPVQGRDVALVRLDRCRGALTIRSRRPGDRFRPRGLGGRKKIQDLFVDLKIARDQRDLVPLVVDGSDRIVWVAGHCVDEEFCVTDPAQAMIILRLKRAKEARHPVGGSA